ncbi:MAG: sulfite exporter TauE/SafE family protein [Candidatus Helarchaeota archaeon]
MELVEILLFIGVGLSASILGALMGVGGGFLMVPVFVFLGFNDDYGANLLAPVLSLFVIIFIALSASVKYSTKHLINYRLGLIYAPFSIMGTFLGTKLLESIGNTSEGTLIFKIIFSVLIIVIGIRLIFKNIKKTLPIPNQSDESSRQSYYWVILWGCLTGFAASLVGIGGGLIAVPVLHLFFLETMHVAIATSLFIMIFTAGFSTLMNYFIYASVLDNYFFLAGILIAIGAVIGSQVGSFIQTHLKAKTLRLIFSFFMIGIAIPLLWLGP